MEDFDDVDVNINNTETRSDNIYQSEQTMVKTKYDGEKDRRYYKNKIRSEVIRKPSTSVEGDENKVSSNKLSTTSIEMRRLEEINGRSTHLVFKHIWELPNVQDIKDLCSDILCVVEAKFRAPSCFCVFTGKMEKERAEKQLEGQTFRNGIISVDSHRKMVPVDTFNLDNTREEKTLAVHGIGKEVTTNDLRKAFPDAYDVKIAQRGGSAFLKYQDSLSCFQGFTGSEDTHVRGYRVQVLFGHFISKNVKQVKQSEGFSFKPSTHYRSPSRVARRNQLIQRTPSKTNLRSLLSALDGSGLSLDEVQTDYIRGGCVPGSGGDIRTAWMDRLKASTRNKLSWSSRMDLVDNIWNYFEDDVEIQRRLRREKSRRSISREKSTSQRMGETDGNQRVSRNETREKRTEERRNKYSPDRKRHRSWVDSSSPKRLRSWEYERYNGYTKINENSRDSSPDMRMPSLKHCKRKIEYDSSSPSPPRVHTTKKCESMDKKIDTKTADLTTEEGCSKKERDLESTSRFPLRSNSDSDQGTSKKKLNFKGLEKLSEKKLKKGKNNYKTEMITSKAKMMSKLREKSIGLKSGSKVIEKVLKKYKRAKEKVMNKQKEKKQIEKLKKLQMQIKNDEETFISLNLTDKEEYFPLTNYMKIELERNECKSVTATVDQICDAFIKEGLRYRDLEQEYLRQLTKSTATELLRERLVSLLTGAGISNSSEICPNLAACLVLDFLNSNPATQTKLVKWRQSSLIINQKLEQLADEDLSETESAVPVAQEKPIPNQILEKPMSNQVLSVSKGFPRMALVMAGRLADTSQMKEVNCKAMAAAMVAVWINYGFTYDEMADIYAKERERDAEGSSGNVSLLGMRRLLHSRLRKKVEEGHEMPRKIGFSLLIDLTMFYFEKAT